MEAQVQVVEWQDEHAGTDYPLEPGFILDGLISDASFVQFDGFRPTLDSVLVETAGVVFTITGQAGTADFRYTLADRTAAMAAGKPQELRMTLGGEFFGVLTIGPALLQIVADYPNRIFAAGKKFLSTCVRPIPAEAGVFSFDGLYGQVGFKAATADKNIFFFTHQDGDSSELVCSAISNLRALLVVKGLRTINGVGPKNNAITFKDNPLLKFNADGAGSLKMTLASSGLAVSTL